MTVDNIVAGQSGLTSLTNLNLIINSVNGHTDGSGNLAVTDIREMSLDTTVYSPTHHEGTLYWNSDEHTLNVMSEISGCVTQVGRELWVRAINLSGVTIENGDAVYIVGASGDKVSVALARSDSESTSLTTIGLATSQITHGSIGYITILGEVHDLNTSAFTEGDLIYVSSTLAGKWTATRPVAPNTIASLGIVSRVNANNGTIVVQMRIQPTIERLSDVLITSVGNGDVLSWNSTNSRWQNTVISGGVTPVSNILEWNGTDNRYQPYVSGSQPVDIPAFYVVGSEPGELRLNTSLYTTDFSSETLFSKIVNITAGGSDNLVKLQIQDNTIITVDNTEGASYIQINRSGVGNFNRLENLININDNPTTSGTISGKVLTATIGSTERISLNPRVVDGATAVAYFEDTHNALTTVGAKIHSYRNQGSEKAYIDKDGVISSSKYVLSALNTAPSSASDTGTTGEIRVTADFVFVCINTNTWVRTALTTWA